MKTYFLKRLREPSTWAGLGGIAIAAGANAGAVDAVQTVIAGLLSLVAVFAPDRIE